MSTANPALVVCAGLALTLGACATATTNPGDGPDAGTADDVGEDESSTQSRDRDGDDFPDIDDNCPDIANSDQTDGDGDLTGDACDCEPDNFQVAARVLANASLEEAGMFAAAPGFPRESWNHVGGSVSQNRLANDTSDALFLSQDHPLTNVRVEVTAASTAITDFDTSDLRQLFLVARAGSSASEYYGVACGIEVVEGLTPTQKTSVILQDGRPSGVSTAVLDREDRELVQVNELFTMRMELVDDTMTCTVTITTDTGVEVTTAEASGIEITAGAVGLFTRETKASFRDVVVCEY